MNFTAAPIDGPILALLQLIQPATFDDVANEAGETILRKLAKTGNLSQNFTRLIKEGLIFEVENHTFIVSPSAYSLISLSLPDRKRDKARLRFLNKQRFKSLGLEA